MNLRHEIDRIRKRIRDLQKRSDRVGREIEKITKEAAKIEGRKR